MSGLLCSKLSVTFTAPVTGLSIAASICTIAVTTAADIIGPNPQLSAITRPSVPIIAPSVNSPTAADVVANALTDAATANGYVADIAANALTDAAIANGYVADIAANATVANVAVANAIVADATAANAIVAGVAANFNVADVVAPTIQNLTTIDTTDNPLIFKLTASFNLGTDWTAVN